jgi:hypothetical protein
MEKEFFCLILVHHKPDQLERLIMHLSQYKNIGIAVHVDKKTSFSLFKRIVKLYPQVYFIKQRVSVNWGGYSMVSATISSLREISTNFKFKSIFLLSGQCLPCCDLNNFFNILRLNNYSYIHLSTSYGNTTNQVTYDYHFHDFKILSISLLKIDDILRKIRFPLTEKWPLSWLIDKLINFILPRRINLPLKMKPYYGIQWWALSSDFIHYFLNLYNSNKIKIDIYYKFTKCPDEWFFHTFFKSYMLNYPLWQDFNYPLFSFSDMSENTGHPCILNTSHHDELLRSKSPFARKFDLEINNYNPIEHEQK